MDDVKNTIICKDCRFVLPTMAAGSIPTVITDPPYGLSFMGKRWDYEVPSVETWQEILRVLKPGGTLLCFAGSRTQHRMACNVEDAGFILKDCIMWIYGSGFPKAKDISKEIDKIKRRDYVLAAIELGLNVPAKNVHDWTKDEHSPGDKWWKKFKEHLTPNQWETIERQVVGTQEKTRATGQKYAMPTMGAKAEAFEFDITAPATAEAKLWDGWKSHGLKPAYEPILVAMKPNDGSYANNALVHDVAGLNIDAARIEFQSEADKESAVFGRGTDILGGNYVGATHSTGETNIPPDDKGRFPANVIFDEPAAAMLDEQSGELTSGSRDGEYNTGSFTSNGSVSRQLHGGSGGASRFFYCAKASKSERNDGCEGLARKVKDAEYRQPTGDAMVDRIHGCGKKSQNHHPTVKPLALMEYLCRLTSTPTGGCVLDPFCGSGTTLLAAYNTGRDYIGIERDPDYVKIAAARLAGAKDKLGLFEK